MKTEFDARDTLCYVVLSIMPSRLPWELLHHNLKNQGPAFSHCTVMQSERFSPIQLRFCNQIRVSFLENEVNRFGSMHQKLILQIIRKLAISFEAVCYKCEGNVKN